MRILGTPFLACALGCILWSGCSRQNDAGTSPSAQKGAAPDQPSQTAPTHNFVIFESDESKDRIGIKSNAKDLFLAKDFEKLDALAAQYRESKESYPNGDWKLAEVYRGLELDDKAPDSDWENRMAVFNEWIKARPESITARVALAEEFVDYAWKARGTGYANTVTPKGWQLMGQRLTRAVQILQQAKGLKEQCPYWHSVMLRAALGLQADRSQYDALFKRAIQSYPDYTTYYGIRAYYLLPRWHGKPGEWEEDLRKTADQIGGDEGDLLYARVAWYVQQMRPFDNIFKESSISWLRADQGFAILNKRFPHALSVKSERAFLAGLGAPREAAAQRFDDLEGKVDLSIWMDRDEFDSFMRWAYKL